MRWYDAGTVLEANKSRKDSREATVVFIYAALVAERAKTCVWGGSFLISITGTPMAPCPPQGGVPGGSTKENIIIKRETKTTAFWFPYTQEFMERPIRSPRDCSLLNHGHTSIPANGSVLVCAPNH